VQLAVYSGNAVTTRAATTQYDAFGVTWRSLYVGLYPWQWITAGRLSLSRRLR